MKRRVIMLLLVPYMAAATTLSDGLVAYYKFNSGLSDSSGNGYGLNVSGTSNYIDDRHGNASSAFWLDGSTVLYEAPDDNRIFFNSNYTFACWFQASEETKLQDVSDSGIYGVSSDIKYLCGDSDSPIAIGTNGVNVFEHGASFLPAVFKYESALGCSWHHLAMTFSENRDAAIYLDGELVGTFVKLKPYAGLGTDLGLGFYKSSVGRFRGIGSFDYGGHFKGGIDDVCFYNRPLLAEEVKALYVRYEWTYSVKDGEAILGGGTSQTTAIPKDTAGPITIPSTLGGYPVTCIGQGAFCFCTNITSVAIPACVTNVNVSAFSGCENLTAFEVADGNPMYASVDGLLYDKAKTTLLCVPSGLTEVTIPKETTTIADGAFENCSKLMSVTFLGTPPHKTFAVFWGTPAGLEVHADATKAGWVQWGGRPLAFDVGGNGGASSIGINLTVTNVIVHYIQTSELSPMAAPVSADVGIVNVTTEIKGGNIPVPDSWTANYPTFAEKFGSDFSVALIRETGKFDAGGKPMYVWQDYVAGTDPTDKDDVFKASVTIVKGVPVVSYTPTLSDAEAAMRKYTTWGKVKLQDEKWVEIPAGKEADYNFFKVTVEMK